MYNLVLWNRFLIKKRVEIPFIRNCGLILKEGKTRFDGDTIVLKIITCCYDFLFLLFRVFDVIITGSEIWGRNIGDS